MQLELSAPSLCRKSCNVWERLSTYVICEDLSGGWGDPTWGKIQFLIRKSLPVFIPVFTLGQLLIRCNISRKLISFKTDAKLCYTINVGGGRNISVTGQAEFGHRVGTIGIGGIPEHLGDEFFAICEIWVELLGRTDPDPLMSLPALLKPDFGLFAFFAGILFLTNRTL